MFEGRTSRKKLSEPPLPGTLAKPVQEMSPEALPLHGRNHADVEQMRFVEHVQHDRIADRLARTMIQASYPEASASAKLPRDQGWACSSASLAATQSRSSAVIAANDSSFIRHARRARAVRRW